MLGQPAKPAPATLDPKAQQEEIEDLLAHTLEMEKLIESYGFRMWLSSDQMDSRVANGPWQAYVAARRAAFAKAFNDLSLKYPHAQRNHSGTGPTKDKASVEAVARGVAELAAASELAARYPYGSVNNTHFKPPTKERLM